MQNTGNERRIEGNEGRAETEGRARRLFPSHQPTATDGSSRGKSSVATLSVGNYRTDSSKLCFFSAELSYRLIRIIAFLSYIIIKCISKLLLIKSIYRKFRAICLYFIYRVQIKAYSKIVSALQKKRQHKNAILESSNQYELKNVNK